MILQPVPISPMSVLLVEDDNMVGLILKEILEEIGFVVCAICATENDAVASAARLHPSVMIVDMHLAEGTGIGAMDRILADGPMPCVFVSGEPDYFIVTPNTAVLRKPFNERDLIGAIRKVTGTSANMPQAR